MSNNEVGFSNGLSMKRHVKGKEMRMTIDGPKAQAEYVTSFNFNAINRNDCDSADWSTSIWTNRYYLCIVLGA